MNFCFSPISIKMYQNNFSVIPNKISKVQVLQLHENLFNLTSNKRVSIQEAVQKTVLMSILKSFIRIIYHLKLVNHQRYVEFSVYFPWWSRMYHYCK